MDNYMSTPGTFTPSTGSRFELTPARKQALMLAGGAGVGAAQTVILRKFMDNVDHTTYPWGTKLDFLGGFANPSALFGVIGGAAGLIAGLFLVRDQRIQNVLVGYSGAALTGGILSGLNMV
jgi:hypothetical protein